MSFIAEFVPIMMIISAIALIFEFMDASLGMGFGTTLTPVLLIMGFPSRMIVPAVLLSELFAGFVSVLFHYFFKNIRLGKKKVFKRRRRQHRKAHPYRLPSNIQTSPLSFSQKVQNSSDDYSNVVDDTEELNDSLEYEEDIVVEDENGIEFHDDDEIIEVEIETKGLINKFKSLTTDSKVVIILATFGILGTLISSILSVILQQNPAFTLAVKIYIGVMVFFMGVLILTFRNRKFKLSMKRIVAIGALAGFNKGISGGGYGPLTVSGQLLAGREGRNAVASTSFSETATCFVGVLAYIITTIVNNHVHHMSVDWDFLNLAPYLVIGAVLATPLAALVTNKVEAKWLKVAVGYATIFLGILSLTRLTLEETGLWDSFPNFVEIYLTNFVR